MADTTRIRQEGEFNPYETEDVFTNHSTIGGCGSVGTISRVTPDANGSVRTMHDVVTPNFHSRVAKGEVIVNPMYRTEQRRELYVNSIASNSYCCPCAPSPTIYEYYGPRYLGGASCEHIRVNNLGQSASRARAATAARADVQSPEFEGAMFIAELSKTIRLVVNPIHGFTTIAKKAKRRKRDAERRARERGQTGLARKWHESTVLDYISSGWLQYRYGIMPLVYSAEDIVDALRATTNRKIRHTARGSDSVAGSQTENHAQVAFGGWAIESQTTTHVTYENRAGIIYEHSISDINNFGSNVQDIPKAMWEIVPFSFVVDWFLNTSDYIAAISPKIGVKELGSWTSTKYTQRSIREWWSSSYTGLGTELESPSATQTRRNESYKRTPGVTASLAFEDSPFSGNLGQKRVADALGLLKLVLFSK